MNPFNIMRLRNSKNVNRKLHFFFFFKLILLYSFLLINDSDILFIRYKLIQMVLNNKNAWLNIFLKTNILYNIYFMKYLRN